MAGHVRVHVKQPVIKVAILDGNVSFLVDGKLNSADRTTELHLHLRGK